LDTKRESSSTLWTRVKEYPARLIAFVSTPEKEKAISPLWAILGLIVALIAALELASRAPGIVGDDFGAGFWLRFVIELTIIILAGSPIFLLIQGAAYRAWKDFDFAKAREPTQSEVETAKEPPTRFEYAYSEFADNSDAKAVKASNITYQRLRFSAFWYLSSSHIVMGAIVLTLVIGVSVYASTEKTPNPEATPASAATVIASRVGIIVLILFLVQILVPLYQYLLRMQAGANARADAMLLLIRQIETNELNLELFERAKTILSLENLPFGKSPRPAIKEFVDLLKEAKELKKESTKGH